MSLVLNQLKLYANHKATVFVACSGGLDSTVLLKAMIQVGLKPIVVHVNYQLRGNDSEQDELFVRKLAHTHHLEIIVKKCPKKLLKGNGVNLQLNARKFRHELFQELLKTQPDSKLFLAHHLDDQIETFFLQLMRGAGIFGLGGMHEENKGIIRPFLSISKTDLQQFANENFIQWREDKSNQENYYFRNAFRNQILPQLLNETPSLFESIAFLQKLFRDQQHFLKEQLENKLLQWNKTKQIQFSDWNTLSIEEKIVVVKYFNWEYWLIDHLNKLESATLSSQINQTELFRTKEGFSWEPKFVNTINWEFKSDCVSALPKDFHLSAVFLDKNKCFEQPIMGFATKDFIFKKPGMRGNTSLYKVLKDAGIPLQWRNSYPILFCGNQICWIPKIGVNAAFIASNDTAEIIHYQLVEK